MPFIATRLTARTHQRRALQRARATAAGICGARRLVDDAGDRGRGKSRDRREAIIPLYGALRDVLARIPKRATTILSSSRRRPWTADGFGSSFNKAKIDAGMSERDLHFNDLRGTAATKFYIAGFSMREIAETLAWEEESVEKIIRRYVGRSAAIKARIKKLETRE